MKSLAACAAECRLGAVSGHPGVVRKSRITHGAKATRQRPACPLQAQPEHHVSRSGMLDNALRAGVVLPTFHPGEAIVLG
jgi:hypothetical protein